MATVFIATSFDAANKSRADAICFVLQLGGHQALLGEGLAGESISKEVRDRIETADGLIALLSRREKLLNGGWSTHSWVLEEAAWALAKGKKVLRVVEDGVAQLGGISGDPELVKYSADQFHSCLQKLAFFAQSLPNSAGIPMRPPVEKKTIFSIIPDEPIEDTWGSKVKELIEKTREKAEAARFEDALMLANRAAEIDPSCWRAHLNQGLALVHLERFSEAEKKFDYVAEVFSIDPTIVARALHNKAWLISMRDGMANPSTMARRKDLYYQSLSLDNRRINTRAILLIYFVLLKELSQARPFLEASLKWKGFSDALRDELDALGALGQDVARKLPRWLRDLLYPTEGSNKRRRHTDED